jgi:hypothetical protein
LADQGRRHKSLNPARVEKARTLEAIPATACATAYPRPRASYLQPVSPWFQRSAARNAAGQDQDPTGGGAVGHETHCASLSALGDVRAHGLQAAAATADAHSTRTYGNRLRGAAEDHLGKRRGRRGAALPVDLDVPGQWWTWFHSPELNALVDEGVKANPDIAAAQAALRSARETLYAQRSSAYPNAQASFSIARQQVPTYYAPPINNQNTEYVYGVHTASLDVAYTPDVFGNRRYQSATAAAAADVQRFEVEATYLTLTSNIVAAAVAAASLRGQIDTTRRIITIDQHLLDLTKSERAYAQADGLDVLTQEAALHAIEQTLPGLESARSRTSILSTVRPGRAHRKSWGSVALRNFHQKTLLSVKRKPL